MSERSAINYHLRNTEPGKDPFSVPFGWIIHVKPVDTVVFRTRILMTLLSPHYRAKQTQMDRHRLMR